MNRNGKYAAGLFGGFGLLWLAWFILCGVVGVGVSVALIYLLYSAALWLQTH